LEKLARRLLAQAQPVDDRQVTLVTGSLEIVQEPAPLAHEFQQTTPGVVVFRVHLEVFRLMRNARAKERNLDFRGARVGIMGLVGLDDGPLLFNPFLQRRHG